MLRANGPLRVSKITQIRENKMRSDGRMADELRPLSFQKDYTRYAEGSVLVRAGDTVVLCTAMVEEGVPLHCRESQSGWVSAEYRMLPSACPRRRSLNVTPQARSLEIQRLIGRSLRVVVDLCQFPGRTIWIDCNVVQADGGTRTASINGAFVALVDALRSMKEKGAIAQVPLASGVAAVSVGVVGGEPMLDLCAEEDSGASVDMNVVMSHEGDFIEVQGTAEKKPFARQELDEMLALAARGIERIKAVQFEVIGGDLG